MFRSFLIIPLFLISALLLSGCMPSETDVTQAEERVDEACEYVEQKEYAKAMKKFEDARKLDEGNQDVYTGVADIYVLKNRTDDAEEILLSGLSHARKTGTINEYLGELALNTDDLENAVKYLKKSVSEDEENYQSRYLLGLTYVLQGSDELALETLDISEAGGEWYVRGALLSAILYWEDTQPAKELLDAAIDTVDVDPSVISLLETYSECIDRVDGLADDDPDVYRDAILAYGALNGGYSDVVIDSLTPYVEDEGEYWELNLYLGRAYEMELEYDSAQTYLEKAVELNPADPYGPWYLARVYEYEGMETEMTSMYNRAISLSEPDVRITIRREYIEKLASAGQYEDLDEHIDALETEDPEHANEYEFIRIETLIERELLDDAATILDGIAQSDVSDELQTEYAWLKGQILFAQGERDEALEWAGDAVTGNELDARYQLLLGQINFELGNEEDAQTALERAIDLDLEGDVSAEAVKVLDRM